MNKKVINFKESVSWALNGVQIKINRLETVVYQWKPDNECKEDEVLSVLQKGEAIFTSKQLATLGQSVNSLVLLNDLQQKQLQIGLTQGFNNNVNSAVPREGNNISFGDININITGVENQEQFGSALKNNIKSIFAQAVAGI